MTLTDVFAYHTSLFLGPLPSKPWRFDGWVCATNGHVLVAFTDDGRDADVWPADKRKATRYLTEAPIDPKRTSFGVLRAFAGEVASADRACADCEGSGRYEFGADVTREHCGQVTRPECDHCGGTGKARLPVRFGRVCGVPVNLALLAYGFSYVPPDDEVTVGHVMTESKN